MAKKERSHQFGEFIFLFYFFIGGKNTQIFHMEKET